MSPALPKTPDIPEFLPHEIPWSTVGYLTYKRTYSRRLIENNPDAPTEEWPDTIERVINGAIAQLNVDLTEDEKRRLRYYMTKLKGTVAGRFLWQLGTETITKLGLPSLQNCFAQETEFLTKEGLRTFADFSDGDAVTIRGRDGWLPATVRSFGRQNIVELTVRRHGRQTQVIRTTSNHRWNVVSADNKLTHIVETAYLTPGTYLMRTPRRTNPNLKPCNIGVQHGLVYGDGHYEATADACAIVPCGDSASEMRNRFFLGNNAKKAIYGLPKWWKTAPVGDENKHYILGFLAGWFAADGSVGTTGTMTLSASSRDALQHARSLFSLLDIYTEPPTLSRTTNPFNGEPAELWRINIHRDHIEESFFVLSKHRSRFRKTSRNMLWEVVSVTPTPQVETVWCVVEPTHEEFALANGILTKNCAFVVVDSPIRPFTWTMDMLMLGSGVGFNIQRKFVEQLPAVKKTFKAPTRHDKADADFIVPDTREGWVALLERTLESAFARRKSEHFRYSTQLIRGKGAPIKGFGGVASGPEILCEGIENISMVLAKRAGKQLRPIDCLDIMNIIGSIVVAGNVRRSAQLAIGDPDDIEYLLAKRWDMGNIPSWRAMSNNSVACDDISELHEYFWDGYEGKGEPYGLINLSLSRAIGRLGETQYADPDVAGYNPCAEQSLANFETCCLAEVYLPNIDSYDEFIDVVTLLYRICKHSLALGCHNKETEKIVNTHMRMGIGVTGYLQASAKQKKWLKPAYEYLREFDAAYSEQHGFPTSIKLTTCKPSGTLSLLPGVTPGVHPGYAQYMIRRISIASNHPLVDVCRAHGYDIEYRLKFDGTPDRNTMLVSFPFSYPEGTILAKDMTAIDQLKAVRELQQNWSDNSVSCTVYYRKEELPEIQAYLKKHYATSHKSLSFLLHSDHGFLQAPYEEITKEQYDAMVAKTTLITSIGNGEIGMDDADCSTGACPIR